jgi:predicted GIY-YIG superfamily endonuclease
MQTLYRLFNEQDQLLYVGISSKWYERFHQHEKTQPWWLSVAKITLENFETRDEVVEAEKRAIRLEKPLHNKQYSMTHESLQEHFEKMKYYIHLDVPVDPYHQPLIAYCRELYQYPFYQSRGKKSIDIASILESAFQELGQKRLCRNCAALMEWGTLEHWAEKSFDAYLEWVTAEDEKANATN